MDRAQPPTSAQHNQFQAEQTRINQRRDLLGLARKDSGHWAVALSGGGIRSATFCLGVLQALARAKAPKAADENAEAVGHSDTGKRLLAQFDYLSTVSGGGYIGSFFGSLFMPDRLRGRESESQSQSAAEVTSPEVKAAQEAYEVLDYEPPGRIRTRTDYVKAPVGAAPLAWLRENGRYLTPNGSGDLFYLLALSLRNLLAVHFVIGMPLLCALTLAMLVQVGVSSSGLCTPANAALCNSLWWLPGAAILLMVAPLMLAFWMIYPRENQDDKVRPCNWASGLYATAGTVFLVVAAVFHTLSPELLLILITCGVVSWLGVLACFGVTRRLRHANDEPLVDNNCVRGYRVLVTRYLAQALIATLVLVFFALVLSLSQWIYELASVTHMVSSAALLPLLIGAVRTLSTLLDDKSSSGWMSRLPLSVIAGVAGITIFILVALIWGVLVQLVNNPPPLNDYLLPIDALPRLAGLALLTLALSFGAGRFIGFINLSSLQSFYSSRLTRAYLGASNGLRFSGKTREIRKQHLSVAQALSGDDIPIEQYYGATPCAPVHLINVTLNLTVDPAEQLVQRDRKGKPLCLAPSGQAAPASVSYIFDGEPRERSDRNKGLGETQQRRSLANWIATSGAAVSTGLGRATTLGTSLSLGLSNMRLGTWWPSNFLEDGETANSRHAGKDKGWAWAFPTQTYLFYELTAHFHGLHRDYQYLSDGGHFENTATYELIREGRKIELIVLCDCGADPTYQFDDLANLIRLARIDQGLEIKEDTDVQNVPLLAPYFGSINNFAKPGADDSLRCAMLFNVMDRHDRRNARILLLKPNVTARLPVDVLNYANAHPTFPNESTADQFFNEAQFESYRQLGLQIGQTLFGNGQPTAVSEALWGYLLEADRKDQ